MRSVKVEKVVFGGKGLAHFPNGQAIFIPKVLPGEEVDIEILKRKKDYVEAWPREIVTQSQDRGKAECPYFEVCGGCSFQNVSYEKQMEYKEGFLKDSLVRIGKFDEAEVMKKMKPSLPSPHPLHYRNKTEFSFQRDEDGRLKVGFHNPRKRFHILDIDACLLHSETAQKALESVRKLAEKCDLDVFSPRTPKQEGNPKGFLYSIIFRTNHQDDILIALNTNESDFPEDEKNRWIDWFQKDLGKQFIGFVQIRKNRQEITSPESFELLWGAETFEDQVLDLKFKIGPKSFFQVNREMATKMIEIVQKEVRNRSQKGSILDFFCGNGFLGMSVASLAQQVTGIEIEPSAVREGRLNLELNGVTNYTFHEGNAHVILRELLEQGETFDTLIVDPPRSGLGRKACKTVLKTQADTIIYISCNPTSLAHDLTHLTSEYEIESFQMLDLFPQTYHLETVCILTHQKK